MRKSKITMYKDWKFWGSLGAGVITGAVAGLLFAPVSGAEMRRRIGEIAANTAAGASNAANRIAGAAQSGAALYGTSAGSARFQIERLFKAVTAGVEETAIVRSDYMNRHKS